MVFDKLPTAFLNGVKHMGIFKNRKYDVVYRQFYPRTSCFDTMIYYQLSQKLKLMGIGEFTPHLFCCKMFFW